MELNRYICIHGHFYQPPRENPWLEEVEMQDSAYPFHDWNQRITEECYKQNASSRILSPDHKIIDIVNNYASISFNFGPTLLSWLKLHTPEIYEKIIEADNESKNNFSGHGSAIAQVYNHIIMPLANSRDKKSQVVWGIYDFEHSFNRKPEGMWLAETAVDTESLDILAEQGIKFTILAPHQARAVRKIGTKKWSEVKEDTLDTAMPYIYSLPSGRSINLFFYNGQVAKDVAYGGLLHSGDDLAKKLISCFKEGNAPQLIHIATDGESFGHHHRYGDMALAYCIHYIRSNNLAKITNYGEYLEKFPPAHEVQIVENTSWSCAHGVERWRSNCGCCAHQALSGKQEWRAPLRRSLDWLRDNFSEAYEKKMLEYCQEPFDVRNKYISIINDRTQENINKFIEEVTGRELPFDQKVIFLKLMEIQRMAMLMYTSCGWFFDNLSGIETVQVIEYACRAKQLFSEVFNIDLSNEFKNMLKEAPANTDNLKNGEDVYKAYVEPARIDLQRVVAHFVLDSIFTQPNGQQQKQIYCYNAAMENYRKATAGAQVLAIGRTSIKSNIVLEEYSMDFAAMHLGGHNLTTALCPPKSQPDFQQTQNELIDIFRKGDTNEVMRQINKKFAENTYSLWHLFRDERIRLLYELLKDNWEEIERVYRHIYNENYQIMLMMKGANMAIPKALIAPAEFILNQDLGRVIREGEIDVNRLNELINEAAKLSIQLDQTTLKYEASTKINHLMEKFAKYKDNVQMLNMIDNIFNIIYNIIPDMDLQTSQNIFFIIRKEEYPQMKEKAAHNDQQAARWIELFKNVAGHLGLVIE